MHPLQGVSERLVVGQTAPPKAGPSTTVTSWLSLVLPGISYQHEPNLWLQDLLLVPVH